VKSGANQILHATMKLYQFTEETVNNILLQRSVMFHICAIVVSTLQVSCLETPGGRSGTRRERRIKGVVST
jgi:hypothetical protein